MPWRNWTFFSLYSWWCSVAIISIQYPTEDSEVKTETGNFYKKQQTCLNTILKIKLYYNILIVKAKEIWNGPCYYRLCQMWPIHRRYLRTWVGDKIVLLPYDYITQLKLKKLALLITQHTFYWLQMFLTEWLFFS